MDKSFWMIIGLYMLLLGIDSGNVQEEIVCLHENVVLRWDIPKYSKMEYAYIKHGHELIVTIAPLTHITIENEFKSQVNVIITESLQIEMTIFNVTKATNGTYTCTLGKISERELIIEKKISVIDPYITLSLDTDYNDCKTLKCSSEYQVALLDPTGRKIGNNRCLFKNDTGKYSCCLLNQRCSSSNCKFIYIDDYGYTFPSVNTEKTTLLKATSGTVDKPDTTSFIIIIMALILLILSMCIGGCVLCLIRRRRIRKFRFRRDITNVKYKCNGELLTYGNRRNETDVENECNGVASADGDETRDETDQSITDFFIEGIKRQFVSYPFLLSKHRRTKST